MTYRFEIISENRAITASIMIVQGLSDDFEEALKKAREVLTRNGFKNYIITQITLDRE